MYMYRVSELPKDLNFHLNISRANFISGMLSDNLNGWVRPTLHVGMWIIRGRTARARQWPAHPRLSRERERMHKLEYM